MVQYRAYVITGEDGFLVTRLMGALQQPISAAVAETVAVISDVTYSSC